MKNIDWTFDIEEKSDKWHLLNKEIDIILDIVDEIVPKYNDANWDGDMLELKYDGHTTSYNRNWLMNNFKINLDEK